MTPGTSPSAQGPAIPRRSDSRQPVVGHLAPGRRCRCPAPARQQRPSGSAGALRSGRGDFVRGHGAGDDAGERALKLSRCALGDHLLQHRAYWLRWPQPRVPVRAQADGFLGIRTGAGAQVLDLGLVAAISRRWASSDLVFMRAAIWQPRPGSSRNCCWSQRLRATKVAAIAPAPHQLIAVRDQPRHSGS